MKEEPTPKRAFIYLRVSTEQQAQRDGDPEGYSIPYQRDACERKAESLSAEVIEEFADLGESAKTADRPQLQLMLERLRRDKTIDYVIVHKVDRLARSLADNAAISLAIEKAGARLVSVAENIDETPSGRLMHGMLASMAEYYSRNLANEIMKGSVQKAKEGGTPFLAPIGYLNVRDFTDGKDVRWIEQDPERAPLVRWAFEAYGTGAYSLRELLDELTAKGLTNRGTAKRPARPLHLSKLAELLANKYYVGTVVYRNVEYQGKHEPLVSRDLFDRVQRILSMHNVAGARIRVHKHHLKGLLRCYRCHSRMGFSYANGNGGVYPYFFCFGRHRGEGCNLPYLPADEVEDEMVEEYRRIQIKLDRIPELKKKLRAELDTNAQQRERVTKRARTRLNRLTQERDRLLHGYLKKLIDDDQFKAEQDRIGREMKDASDALAEQTVLFAEVEDIVTRCLEVVADCRGMYLKADEDLRLKLNQLFFKLLEVDTKGIARTELTDEMSMLIGEEIAPTFHRERRELAYSAFESSPRSRVEDRELVSLGVGSSNAPLVEVRGVEPGGADKISRSPCLRARCKGPKTSALAQMPALLGLQSVCSLGRIWLRSCSRE